MRETSATPSDSSTDDVVANFVKGARQDREKARTLAATGPFYESPTPKWTPTRAIVIVGVIVAVVLLGELAWHTGSKSGSATVATSTYVAPTDTTTLPTDTTTLPTDTTTVDTTPLDTTPIAPTYDGSPGNWDPSVVSAYETGFWSNWPSSMSTSVGQCALAYIESHFSASDANNLSNAQNQDIAASCE